MKKKIIFLITAILLGLLLFLVYFFVLRKPAKEIHYHAGFLVYLDGKIQDFTLGHFMETEPCYVNKSKRPPEDNQKEKAHLHDAIGDVVHVHRESATWGDLFKNINFSFPATESAVGYVNGSKIDNILSFPIKPYDSVIIVSGSSEGVDLNHYVAFDHIKEVESKSESCGIQ